MNILKQHPFASSMLLLAVLLAALSVIGMQAKAASGDNVFGFAWSSTIGWISMSSTNCDADNDGFSNGSPAGCPPVGAAVVNYGVNIDKDTGNFSGFGWSSNIGWIDFNPASTPPGETSPNPARLAGNTVTGWAKAVAGETVGSGGWDGWIEMSGTYDDGAGKTGSYGVTKDAAGDFGGYAWGSDVVGWVDFSGVAFAPRPTGNIKANGVDALTLPSTTEITLSWTSSDATDCRVNATPELTGTSNTGTNIGTQATNRIYGLRCDNSVYHTDVLVDSVMVTIDNSLAKPSITIDKRAARLGEDITLTWDTRGNLSETCTIAGPGVSPSPFDITPDTQTGTVQPLTAVGAGVFKIECPGGSAEAVFELIPGIFES